jgi:eukaryotic-like serine/threonine-protein kinase
VSGSNLTRIGKYEISGILGRGGMGLVYRAFDKKLGREVAIKTLTEGFVGDSEMLERFYQEAAKTGMLKHPNIVTVYDLGEQDGFPYIVMEYVAGDALDRVIQADRPLPLAFKLSIIEQVCHALGYAHRNDVIHRDVKPANVILQPDGAVKLLDFGIAQQENRERGLTRAGSVIGTIHYMAPERLRHRAFDGRSDIFSTGVMFYLLLTGQLPFPGEDYAVIQKLLHEPYPPLASYKRGYPPELDMILARALAKEPEDRYVSADDMASEILGVAEQLNKEQVVEMFQRAERLVSVEQYTEAREILLKVARLDSQHVGARRLMVLVQQNLAQRQRAAQVQQLRAQAEGARLEKQFGDAIAYLEQALKLDPSSSELTAAVDSLRQKKLRYEQVEGYLRQVEDARQRGDFDSAQAVIAKAIELDKEDSRVRAASAALVRQAEEGVRLAKTRKLLESARSELGARHFTAAIKLLSEAEHLDPSNPELISLLSAAKSGQEHEQRRRVVERLQNEIAIVVTADEVGRALAMVNEALAKMPNEPTLVQFKGQLERQKHENETRRLVDETVQKCRALLESSPGEALQMVQARLREFPANERLQMLQGNIEEHLQRVTAEEARVRYVTLANEALDKRQYREAVRLLETCHAEGAFSDEMTGLLDFARHEANREQRASIIEATLSQAQTLIAKGAYEDAIKFLDPEVRETDDLALRNLLEKARAQQQHVHRKADAISTALAGFIQEEQFDEGVAFLESQPEDVLQVPAVKEALKALRSARDRERRELQAIGVAYAALDRADVSTGWSALQGGMQAHSDSSFLGCILQAFEARRRALANRALNSATERAQVALSVGHTHSAQQALEAVAMLAEYASLEVQSEWRRLGKEISRSDILSRIGLKGPRAG